MNKWSQAVEKDDKDRLEIEKQRKGKLLSNQEYLKGQISSNPQGLGVQSTNKQRADELVLKKKYTLGGQMNPEEARMNRELLKEIAKVKRGESPSKNLMTKVDAPF